jgi:hypothetical protein
MTKAGIEQDFLIEFLYHTGFDIDCMEKCGHNKFSYISDSMGEKKISSYGKITWFS